MTGEVISAGVVLGFLTFVAWEMRTYQGAGGPVFRAAGWILFVGMVGTLIVGGVMLLMRMLSFL